MVAEILLRKHAERLTRRYLTFRDGGGGDAPKPDAKRRYLLYVHIPFCEELCPFCSFLRTKFEASVAVRYFDALRREMDVYHKRGYQFDSMYVGGGTPTIMPEKLAEIVSYARSLWSIEQLSVETNPNHLTGEILDILKEMGVNRLSVGVQSFDDEILKSVERYEKYGSGAEIRQRLRSVVGMFDTVNVDMIFNFPNQTAETLKGDIRALREVGAEQITWYPLMISQARSREIAARCGKIDYGVERRLYAILQEGLAETHNAESIWCFSKVKGLIDEYPVEHAEYAGIGAGSMGFVDGTLYFNTFSIPGYMDLMLDGKSPVIAARRFGRGEKLRFRLLMELLRGSVGLEEMKEKYGKWVWWWLGKEVLFLLGTGGAVLRGGRIVLTAKGRYWWLVIMRTLFSTLGDYRDMHIHENTV
jgi:coproporphyrinogen III oxidase-like Fe-S oxidoreductase